MARRRRHAGELDPTKMVPDPAFRPVSLKHAKEGWRAWIVDKDLPKYGAAPKLHSVSFGYAWAPKRKAEAECPKCGQNVPGEECSCGFYSAKNLRHLMQMGYSYYGDIDESKSFKVVGQVALWGKVVEGTQGWRSQYAYPVYLLLPYEMGAEFGKRIRDAYGARIRLMNWLKQPGEVTDEDIAAILAGKPKAIQPTKVKQKGRRVTHKALRFDGMVAGEPYKGSDGVKYVDVTWDVTPDRTARTPVESLEWHAIR